jgi:hypothetical protein
MFVMSAAFLAAVAIMAVFIAVSGGGGGEAGQTTPSAAAPPTGGAPAPSPARGCAPTDTNQQTPRSPPGGVTWQVHKGMALPISTAAGPMQVSGDTARCYARTPTGALIAAVQLGYRSIVATDWRAMATQLADGPGKTAWIRRREASPSPNIAPRGETGQIAGFRFIAYAPNVAVLQIAYRHTLPDQRLPRFFGAVISLSWQGDWQLKPEGDGSGTSSGPTSNTLDGYIPWGAV